MPSSIELRDVSVSIGGISILRNVDLSIAAGEAVALIGRSGAGKTTTLRLMNGLVTPTSGVVAIDGAPIDALDLVTLRRQSGYIIQGAGLFPHRTVRENVATVPRLLGWEGSKIDAAVDAVLARVGLLPHADRRPGSLSGGEQQRVGIARAIVASPAMLLCDEPFAALDPIVRGELQDLFITFRAGATVVFVTHDLREAARVADRIVLFDDGRVVADQRTEAFLINPLPLAERFVASARLSL